MAEEDRSTERSQSSGMHGDTVKLALKLKHAVLGLLKGALIADVAAAAPFGPKGTLGQRALPFELAMAYKLFRPAH